MSDEPPPQLDPLAPWPTLAERDAGQHPEPELFEDVPPHLDPHLRTWVQSVTRPDLAQRVLTRCRASWENLAKQRPGGNGPDPGEVLNKLAAGELDGITTARPLDRLSVLNAIINIHPYWDRGATDGLYRDWLSKLDALDSLLQDSGSAWRVDVEFRGLYRRVDPTATEAWRRARQAATDANRTKASMHLAEAWKQIYGQHPDPDAGYASAVKAVEAAAVPMLFPDSGSTIHAVAKQLRKNLRSWRFSLVENLRVPSGDGSIDVVASMLDRLLTGQTERHTSDEANRPNTPEEAETAVHLAVVLVQWFTNGAIQPRGTNE